jgi:hypothetical protein
VKHRSVEWFDFVGLKLPTGRDAGGLIVAESGRVVGVAFPGLAGIERDLCRAVIAEHGQEVAGGVEIPVGVAEVQVGFLERIAGGRLREPVATAVRLTC